MKLGYYTAGYDDGQNWCSFYVVTIGKGRGYIRVTHNGVAFRSSKAEADRADKRPYSHSLYD